MLPPVKQKLRRNVAWSWTPLNAVALVATLVTYDSELEPFTAVYDRRRLVVPAKPGV